MHKFNPAHIGKLLREDRLGAITPLELLRSLGLKDGDTLADVGCGPGFFTIPAAALVGPNGVVYAIDTQREMLDALRERPAPANVVPVQSTEHSIPLESSIADAALVAFVLHEATDKRLFMAELKRIVRIGGIVAVLDWKKQEEAHGPPEQDRLTEAEVEALFREAGFTGVQTASLNESHYRVSAVKG